MIKIESRRTHDQTNIHLSFLIWHLDRIVKKYLLNSVKLDWLSSIECPGATSPVDANLTEVKLPNSFELKKAIKVSSWSFQTSASSSHDCCKGWWIWFVVCNLSSGITRLLTLFRRAVSRIEIMHLRINAVSCTRLWKLLNSVNETWRRSLMFFKRPDFEMKVPPSGMHPDCCTLALSFDCKPLRWMILDPIPNYWLKSRLPGHTRQSTFSPKMLNCSNDTCSLLERMRCLPCWSLVMKGMTVSGALTLSTRLWILWPLTYTKPILGDSYLFYSSLLSLLTLLSGT